MMVNVYVASKLKYAEKLRALREPAKAKGINLHARWFDQATLEDEASPEDFHVFWLVDEHDVKVSKALIVYGEDADELRGALIEAGIAIGAGIPVFVVGASPSFGTWCNHPHVIRAASLDYALTMIVRLYVGAAQ